MNDVHDINPLTQDAIENQVRAVQAPSNAARLPALEKRVSMAADDKRLTSRKQFLDECDGTIGVVGFDPGSYGAEVPPGRVRYLKPHQIFAAAP